MNEWQKTVINILIGASIGVFLDPLRGWISKSLKGIGIESRAFSHLAVIYIELKTFVADHGIEALTTKLNENSGLSEWRAERKVGAEFVQHFAKVHADVFYSLRVYFLLSKCFELLNLT